MTYKRDLNIRQLSKAKYRELFYFCMQFKEKLLEGNIKDTRLIEDTAEETDKELAEYILKNVTEGIPYEYMNVPCGRKQFYEKRRQFFTALSKKR